MAKPGGQGRPPGRFRNRIGAEASFTVSGVRALEPKPHRSRSPVCRSPRRAPRQGRSPGGSPLGGYCEPKFSILPPVRSSWPRPCLSFLRAPWRFRRGFRLAVVRPKPFCCRFRRPSRDPVLPEVPRNRSFSVHRLAMRRSEDPALRRTRDWPEPFLRPRDRTCPKACPSLWALYEACRVRFRIRASPQLPPGGGFVSRPALAPLSPGLVGQETRSARAVILAVPSLPPDRLGHVMKLSRKPSRTKRIRGDSPCG